eukprot:Pgem_evm1s15302
MHSKANIYCIGLGKELRNARCCVGLKPYEIVFNEFHRRNYCLPECTEEGGIPNFNLRNQLPYNVYIECCHGYEQSSYDGRCIKYRNLGYGNSGRRSNYNTGFTGYGNVPIY